METTDEVLPVGGSTELVSETVKKILIKASEFDMGPSPTTQHTRTRHTPHTHNSGGGGEENTNEVLPVGGSMELVSETGKILIKASQGESGIELPSHTHTHTHTHTQYQRD